VIGGFATLALVLALVGFYGTLSFMVRQQTRDIGLRLALGATPETIAGQVLRRVVSLTAMGVLAGLFLAFMFTRLMESLLYEIRALDWSHSLASAHCCSSLPS
jgi:ABC-type antimicrobial peptide transport system permease subunit